MSPRAPALSPDERRAALVAATIPLLREHGRAVTTRQIAQAAGVAEGTIFRVFDTKEELVDAAVRKAFDTAPMLERIAAIPVDDDLRTRLLALVGIIQERLLGVFGIVRKVGLVAPPDRDTHRRDHDHGRLAVQTALVTVIADDAPLLRVPPERLLHYVRLLTFAGSHEEIADGMLLTPEEIVDLVLDGALARPPRGHRCPRGATTADVAVASPVSTIRRKDRA